LKNAKLKLLAAITAVVAIPTMSTAQTAPQANTCLFYEHFNYEGEQFGLHKGDMLSTSDKVAPTAVYAGGLPGKNFVAPQWAGRVSSLKVPKGCMAIVYNGKDKAVGPRSDLSQFSAPYNDKSVGFGCHCP